MATNIRTYLLFEGAAEEAMNYYVSLFPNSVVLTSQKYEEGDSKGKLSLGTFTLAGREFMCIDSPIKHDFGLTPAISIFVDCDSATEQEGLFEALSTDGEILMPLDNYGFSTRFTWVQDRFGVSWQLNLP
jgi:predicted 3-demethylubiquinone-9 3-methyltransferase (glyoxalase superfamily)